MANYAPLRKSYDTGDRRWLPNMLKAETHGVTLDGTLFPVGLVKSGTHVGVVTSSKLGGLYNGVSEEAQSVTISGAPTGGTFTLSFGGNTTSAIAYNASAAAVQAALEALASIGAGNVSVSGAAGGPYTVTFVGALANTNVAQLTATGSLTGGSSPAVAVATTTAGGSAIDSPAGLGKSTGHLLNDWYNPGSGLHHQAVVHGGTVDRRFLPAGNHDSSAEADLTAIAYIH